MLSVITPGSTQQCIPSTSSYVHGDYHARWQTSSWAQHPAAYFFPGGGSPYPSSTPYHPVKSRKDYSKPLYVDCSIEYELPNAPKVPKHSEPILMIHPDYSSNKSNPTPSAQKTVQHSRSLKRSYGQSFSEEIMLSQGMCPTKPPLETPPLSQFHSAPTSLQEEQPSSRWDTLTQPLTSFTLFKQQQQQQQHSSLQKTLQHGFAKRKSGISTKTPNESPNRCRCYEKQPHSHALWT
ncbi:Uncharacterized protein FKW44_003248 [Caligus rogercresseyi]|uniref:Uncharacterized protein n=1 Tax=Caligus rogercresseyi TaxID=217165 RepID=A0A7T8QWY9_CALRO|nr:Uncharacterized protein FKW44_003248 [Caligus rogercresseyi]